MQHALALAQRGKGRTSPNPTVGAVAAKNGEVIGEGWTQPAGGDHAEVVALRRAGCAAYGAELYVTLEPCHRWGRTPPCTDALRDAGIAKVHVATLDPNPRESGKGIKALLKAGICVEIGEGQETARDLNADYARFVTSRRPWVLAKYAMSLDGRIATRDGESRYLTGSIARKDVHHLRDEVDAILVGINTVLLDNPYLNNRLSAKELGREPRHPWRLILDSHARIPLGARVLDPAVSGRTSVCVSDCAPADRVEALRARGADIIRLPSTRDTNIDLQAMTTMLKCHDVMSLLVEGGATVHGSFVSQGLVDRLIVYVAPILIGGQSALGPVGGQGVSKLSDAISGCTISVERMGRDHKLICDLATVKWPDLRSLPNSVGVTLFKHSKVA